MGWIPILFAVSACHDARCCIDHASCPEPPPAEVCVPPRAEMTTVADCTDDVLEPNDDLTLATLPTAPTNCASTTRHGVIAGYQDVDVYATGACDLAIDPWAELGPEVDGELRVCIFLACEEGMTNVKGCYKDVAGDSDTPDERVNTRVSTGEAEAGFRGCCRSGPGRVHAQVQCSGNFASPVDAFIWLDSGEEPDSVTACYPYSVEYRMQ